MSPHVTQDALLEAARRHRRPGISAHAALVLAYCELLGCPLNPERSDHAALILRAQQLVLEDVQVAEALKTAVRELLTCRRGGAP